ncbi:MAG: DUF3037 domain-containing protein [Chryseobacterium sp.]|nr:MAG: DUF3037 domain-containing protein [Chryseobacterium sp.]
MQERDLYEYAIVRLVPRVERGECINVGLVMFCKRKRWLKMDFHLDEQRIKAFAPTVDIDFIEANLQSFKKIAAGEKCDSPIVRLDTPDRFRWLTAVRSSGIQTSRPHVGMTDDLEKCFERMFGELVL